MKLGLFLIAGAVPLGVLTVSSTISAFSAPAPQKPIVPDDDSGDALTAADRTAWKKAADDCVADLDKEGAGFSDKIQQADLLVGRGLTPDQSLQAPKSGTCKRWFEKAHSAWSSASKAHDGLVKFLAVALDKNNTSQKLLALQSFGSQGADNPLTGIQGAPIFANFADQFRLKLEPLVKAEEKWLEIEPVLNDPKNNCTVILDKLRQIPRGNLSPELLTKIRDAERRAEFWKLWLNAPPPSDTSKTALKMRRDLLNQARALAQFPDELDKVRQIADSLKSYECGDDRDQLIKEPPEDVREYLRRAKSIIEACPDMRPSLRTAFQDWLAKRLPKVPVNDDLAKVKMGTSKKSKTIYFGVYMEPSKQNEGDPYYYYWPTLSEYKAAPTKKDNMQYHVVEATVPLQLTAKLTSVRQELVKDWKTRQTWEDVQMRCADAAKEWDDIVKNGVLDKIQKVLDGKKIDTVPAGEYQKFASEVLLEWEAVKVLIGD